MPDQDGKEIAQGVLTKMAEFKKSCDGLDEENSSRAPEGRWSPKQIISHLCGSEGGGPVKILKSFIELDKPEIDLDPENTHWTGKRSRMSLAELLSNLTRNILVSQSLSKVFPKKNFCAALIFPRSRTRPLESIRLGPAGDRTLQLSHRLSY